ncbi:hypothetical protein [Roseateles amylovorans]|uniref:DUF4148 domain-containing protein n=1 Tax=Roseateles amylovorans TaxID=2978473 RepID=A0ABY6AYW7_9BURK|nr:hypothetical protein [Roseateles amylovorans]UXH78374.1 hypothetical protein N4261_00045 [Roseateles amylovorans]
MTFNPLAPAARTASSRLLFTLVLGGSLLSGLTTAALAAPDQASVPTTRASVLMDLKDYQDSGLAALERDDSRSQIGSPQWTAARDRYLMLRMISTQPDSMTGTTRAQVLADLMRYRDSGLAAIERRDGEASHESSEREAALARYEALSGIRAMSGRSLSRAEVLADLHIYQESGLVDLDRADAGPAVETAAYQAALAKYESLRSGSRYQTLLTRFQDASRKPG